jgi:hyaluronoglucosaminidase
MRTIPFQIRGVVEGFYGAFYTAPERDDLIRFIGRHGYNFYLYGPKNDRQHRARWREAYPAKFMAQFAQTVAIANEAGVTFGYAISPGVSISYSSADDFAILTGKLRAFYDIGVRAFSLWLDDIAPSFQHDADRQRYHSYAQAHVDLCNRLYDWLYALDPAIPLSLCPTDYHGAAPFSDYLRELGAGLHPAIDIFYTGTEICSPTIPAADAIAFAEAVQRPPLIWDNYPTNDLTMQSELHIGPIHGRDSLLYTAAKGVFVNPMIQAEASKIPLLTYADYFADPICYNPGASWKRALWYVAGDDSAQALRTFAENSLYSCLGGPEAEKLQLLVDTVLTSLRAGGRVNENEAVQALEAYFTELDEACYHLKFRMDNLALRNNLVAWIELLELWLWMGRRALLVLQALERGEPHEQTFQMMTDWLDDVLKHHKRIAGKILLPLAEYVFEKREQQGITDAAASA